MIPKNLDTLPTITRLDVDMKFELPAAGSRWLRICHMRANIPRVQKRFELGTPQTSPVAVIGLGPSLLDTWQEIPCFAPYIITTSGAHRFLIDRGIIPKWHVDIDPREHKVGLLGAPHSQVKYLLSSMVHPSFLDLLEGYDVTLFHALSSRDDISREVPRDEWAIAGGGSVAGKALVIARMLGFKTIHTFGLDRSMRKGESHAVPHPNRARQSMPCEYLGVEYQTTPVLLQYAQSFLRVMDKISDATFICHGEGLLQAMAHAHTPDPSPVLMAGKKPLVISPEYRDQLRRLHQEKVTFGAGFARADFWVGCIKDLVAELKPRSVLDYGCGKGFLGEALDFPIWEYDPAIPGKDRDARAADLVVCLDTLEHVEPDKLNAVLMDLCRCVLKYGYFAIATQPAHTHMLPDGRNAHLIQEEHEFWMAQLEKFFVVARAFTVEGDGPPAIHYMVLSKEFVKCSAPESVPGEEASMAPVTLVPVEL